MARRWFVQDADDKLDSMSDDDTVDAPTGTTAVLDSARFGLPTRPALTAASSPAASGMAPPTRPLPVGAFCLRMRLRSGS